MRFLLPLIVSSFALADYVPDEVIVRFEFSATPDQIHDFERNNELELIKTFQLINTRHYKLPESLSVEEALEQFPADSIVKHVEVNEIIELQSSPSDTQFDQQWSLKNTGQVVNNITGPADVDIDWDDAMNLYTASRSVVVAVVDTGLALDHPELADKIWVNPREALDGVDSDQNGYVDDVVGWDFAENDNLPLDKMGHGTLVSSIIAGAMDNGEGGAGVAPDAFVMPLRIADNLDRITNDAVCGAFEYAILNGAWIVNYSAGSYSESLCQHDLIEVMESVDMLFVAAAGNGGADGMGDDNDDSLTPTFFPASFNNPNIISVAAMDRFGDLTAFSNLGAESVDLAAPGADIFGADVHRTTNYEEDFENGASDWLTGAFPGSSTDQGWSLFVSGDGNTWITDSVDSQGDPVNYVNDAGTYVESPAISLGANPVLTFSSWYQTERFFDFFFIEASDDQENWEFVDFRTGQTRSLCSGCATVITEDLGRFELSEVFLRFSIVTDSAVTFDGVYIDDIRIRETELFQYDGTQYQYNNGTSFSAPLVSGAAAVMWSQKPAMPYDLVKAFLLETVDQSDALSQKVASGGSLNLYNSLALMLADADNDGLDNADEFTVGTDPTIEDTDGDGVNDGPDAFPLDSSESVDTDGDGVGNNTDTDDDGDGVPDSDDAFPLDPNESADTDGDGVGDNADVFPNDASETKDTDDDGIGDNADNCLFVRNPDQTDSNDDGQGDACPEDNSFINLLPAINKVLEERAEK